MVLILSSVRAAVLLLRGQMWEMSLSDHSITFCSSNSGHREGSVIKLFSINLLSWQHRQVLLKVQIQKIFNSEVNHSVPFKKQLGELAISAKEDLKGVRYKPSSQGGCAWAEKAEGDIPGRQSLWGKKIGVKFWGAEKMGLLIPLGKESKKIFRDLVALEQSLER